MRWIVLDNTWLTRAVRSHVVDIAVRHEVPALCVWLDTPLAQAQVNLVDRVLERFGSLPAPGELRDMARREPGLLMPASQMRALRELEPPSADEGWSAIERLAFVRNPRTGQEQAGVFVAAAALTHPGWQQVLAAADAAAPHLLFDWRPDVSTDSLDEGLAKLRREVSGPVASALCPHPAGPPTCWCRPPLPGLPLEFARAHGIDPARSILAGTGSAHRLLATAIGARFVPVHPPGKDR